MMVTMVTIEPMMADKKENGEDHGADVMASYTFTISAFFNHQLVFVFDR